MSGLERIVGGCRVAVPGVWLALAAGFAVPGGAARAASHDWTFGAALYSDVKARQVGDIVTVLIEENSKMSREARQGSGKSTTGQGSASIQHPTIERGDRVTSGPWTRVTLPEFGWNLSHDFTGGGQLSSQEDFTSTMSARVLDVLPNGNLLLEGRRTVHLEQERVEVILSGIVRPRDITSQNTVDSSRIADASIRYVTDGPISRDQQRGALTRLLNWLNPFSREKDAVEHEGS